MPYLQLRITIDPSSATASRTRDRVFRLCKSFLKNWVDPMDPSADYTGGYEQLNKYGELCDPHFHINVSFEPPDLKDPLRSAKNWLKKKALASDFTLKGNKVWSCTLVDEPKDYERWIRYPLKEHGVEELISSNFVGDYAETLAERAHAERKRSIEINILKRQKLADKRSFRDKLFKHLDGLHTAQHKDDPQVHDLPDHQIIWISILNYYNDEGKAVCFKTINGYTILYQLHIGTLTPDQCYAMRSNPQ